MKIVYCMNIIHLLGGTERVTVTKANALAEIPGNEVYIAVTDVRERGGFTLSERVHLVDWGIRYFEDDWKSWWHMLKGVVVKRRKHRKALAELLRRVQPDVVLSVGQCEKYFLPFIKGDWKVIREEHFTRNYRTLAATGRRRRCVERLKECWESIVVLRHYDRIVLLTEEDRKLNWQGWKNVVVIPNPCAFPIEKRAALEAKRVVAVGRLVEQKNYASLIRAYMRVAARHPEWGLEIWGSGSEQRALERLIASLGLEAHVQLKGASTDVQSVMQSASCLAMTSRYEGLGMVLIEAMSQGLPVVSYACPCGPRDIISNGVDGFLVPQDDEEALAESLCRIMEDEPLRRAMGQAAFEKAKQYSVENIVNRWMELFASIV